MACALLKPLPAMLSMLSMLLNLRQYALQHISFAQPKRVTTTPGLQLSHAAQPRVQFVSCISGYALLEECTRKLGCKALSMSTGSGIIPTP